MIEVLFRGGSLDGQRYMVPDTYTLSLTFRFQSVREPFWPTFGYDADTLLSLNYDYETYERGVVLNRVVTYIYRDNASVPVCTSHCMVCHETLPVDDEATTERCCEECASPVDDEATTERWCQECDVYWTGGKHCWKCGEEGEIGYSGYLRDQESPGEYEIGGI